VCIDFRNLNKSTCNYEYHIHIADMLLNDDSGHRVFSFLDNAGLESTMHGRGRHVQNNI
jgi:hypothetical protein